MRILLVDDEKDVRSFLTMILESESFVVDAMPDGEKGSYAARTNEYDLIILDNIMPKKTGSEVIREIREAGKQTPILMLSVQSDIEDKVTSLDLGADDYLTKPFSHRELLSRVRALLRRKVALEPSVFESCNVRLNSQTQEVTCDNKSVYLTRKEFALLELFFKNKGRIVSRGTIMEHVWNSDADPLSKTIETHIVNLRKKIESKKRKIILNVPGRGYKIAF
jgi:DNA-binding response OmpR family regulator